MWVANPDGTEAHEFLPYEPLSDVPDYQNSYDSQYPHAWSPDGSRLLFSFSRVEYAGPQDGLGTVHSGLALTDSARSEPEEFESLCPAEPDVETDRYNFCEARLDDQSVITFSPDGTRVAYVIYEDWGSGRSEVEASALAILDLSTGSVTKLGSTQTTNRVVIESDLQVDEVSCAAAASQGHNSSPAWSPDGTRLAFVRSEIGPAENRLCQTGLFTVDVIGGEVSQVMLSREFQFQDAHWSPDGSSLLFHGATLLTFDPEPTTSTMDAYTIRPDGSGLQTLTSDGSSMWPHWTLDERIVFLREALPNPGRFDLWIMDADGGNATRLDATIPALTAAGCVVCPNPIGDQFDWALWQPVPADQP